MRITKSGATEAKEKGSGFDRSKPRYGFPMEYESYMRYGLTDGTHHGVVLGVFYKDKDGVALTTRAGDPMIRATVGFRGDTDEGGFVQIDYYMPAESGFYANFVEHVLPEDWAAIQALKEDDETYDVRESKAFGRLVCCVVQNEEYPAGSDEWRPKIMRFVPPSPAWVAAGPTCTADPGGSAAPPPSGPAGKPKPAGKPAETEAFGDIPF